MSNATKELVAKLLKNREFKVDLGDGLFVIARRPTEAEVQDMLRPHKTDPTLATINVEIADVKKAVVGWEGFTEAAILGADIGSADPLEFDPELWGHLAADDRGWYMQVSLKMLEAITEHNKKKIAAAKNFEPG